MAQNNLTKPSEDEIRMRSYLIWEREGRLEGKDREHWLQAKAELDAEYEAERRAASLEGESSSFVLPLLPISSPPSRSVSAKITAEMEPQPASAARR